MLYSLTSGLVLQAQVSGYTDDGLPEVYLYACYAKDVSNLNLPQLSLHFTSLYLTRLHIQYMIGTMGGYNMLLSINHDF